MPIGVPTRLHSACAARALRNTISGCEPSFSGADAAECCTRGFWCSHASRSCYDAIQVPSLLRAPPPRHPLSTSSAADAAARLQQPWEASHTIAQTRAPSPKTRPWTPQEALNNLYCCMQVGHVYNRFRVEEVYLQARSASPPIRQCPLVPLRSASRPAPPHPSRAAPRRCARRPQSFQESAAAWCQAAVEPRVVCTADDGTIAAETPERTAALSVYIVVALALSAVAVSIVQKRRTRALRRLRDRERSVDCVSVAGQQQSADHQGWPAETLLAGGGGTAVGLGGILPSGGPSAQPGAGALASPPPPQQRPPRPAGGGLHGKGAGVTGLLLPYQGACF